jgi:hypothetical protein
VTAASRAPSPGSRGPEAEDWRAARRRANQGFFEILPRDPVPGQSEQNHLFKTVRVVATIE